MKALEETDKELAIKVISDPELDSEQLSGLLQISFDKSCVNKNTNQPITLSKEVLMAGVRNRFKQIIDEHEENES